MKQQGVFILLMVVLVALISGCASDYDKYADTMKTHATAESDRIKSQAAAIRDVVAATNTDTKMEKTLLAVIAMMQLERLQPVPLGLQKPMTWTEVGYHFVNQIPLAFSGYYLWKLGEAGIESAASTVFNGDADIANSFNRPEVHTTGSDNQSSYTGTSPAAEPVIVRPEVVIP